MVNSIYILILSYAMVLPVQGIYMFGSEFTYSLKYFILMLVMVGLLSTNTFRYQPWQRITLLLTGFLYAIWSGLISIWGGGGLFAVAEAFSVGGLIIVSSMLIGFMYNLPINKLKNIVKIFLLSSIGVLVLSWLYIILNIDFYIPESFRHYAIAYRLHGLVKSPNTVSCLAFTGIILVYLAIGNGWLGRYQGITLLSLFIISLLATFSKSSIFSMLIVILFLATRRNRVHNDPFKSWRVYLIVIISFSFALVLINNVIKPDVHFNDNPLLNALRIKENVYDTGKRLMAWKFGLSVIEQHWILGIGQFNWKLYSYQYIEGDELDSPHNGFLELFGGLGIIGMLFYFFLPLLFLKISCYLALFEKNLFLSCLIFTYFREIVEVNNVYNNSLVGMLFWFLISIIVALGMKKRTITVSQLYYGK